jgi:hypothetical protein
MAIWWISADDPTSPLWKASVQHVQALVRARTRREALTLSIDVFKDHLVSPSALDAPGVYEQIVTSRTVGGSGYPAEGPSAILEVTGPDDENGREE